MEEVGFEARAPTVAEVENSGLWKKDEEEEQSKRWRTRDSYTPPKRRVARACALPDGAVAVSACGLAVWSFTFLINYLTICNTS